MNIQYNNIPVSNNFFTPSQTKIKPKVILNNLDTNKLYTLIMTDPDAISGNFIHWIIVNIPGSTSNIDEGKEILEYYGPSPPKNTGIHHYTFLLFEQLTNVLLDSIYNRNMPLKELLQQLGINGYNEVKPKYISMFNTSGGKRIKTKRNKTKRNKTKRNKTKKT